MRTTKDRMSIQRTEDDGRERKAETRERKAKAKETETRTDRR